MTPAIPLDLRDLDDAKVAEAMPHIGECKYAAPCIIGTLIPVKDRRRLEGKAVRGLAESEAISFPSADQVALAQRLQGAFDWHNVDAFNAILARIRALPA